MLMKSAALLAAIKEYEQNKWKVIGQKVGKPAKVGAPWGDKTEDSINLGQQTDRLRLANSTRKSILGTKCREPSDRRFA